LREQNAEGESLRLTVMVTKAPIHNPFLNPPSASLPAIFNRLQPDFFVSNTGTACIYPKSHDVTITKNACPTSVSMGFFP